MIRIFLSLTALIGCMSFQTAYHAYKSAPIQNCGLCRISGLKVERSCVSQRTAVQSVPWIRTNSLIPLRSTSKRESLAAGHAILRDLLGGMPVTGGYSSFSELFAKFDKDLSGKISLQELQTTLKEMGAQLSDSQVQEILFSMDSSGDGEVNWSEFMAAVEQIESELYDSISTNSVMLDDEY